MKEFWNTELMTLAGGASLTVGKLAYVAAIVLLGIVLSSLLARFVGRRLQGARVTPDAAQMMQRVVFYVALLVVALTTLSLLQIPLTAFAFLSGAVAIGFGFGAQNIINNFISGWILMSSRPVRIGDFVEVDETKGVIERITNRSTQIRRTDGAHLLVPNSLMLERTVTNWSLVDRDIRTVVRVGVAYGSPVEKVRDLLLQVAAADERILKEPKPFVVFEDFGDNALIFDLYFWSQVTRETEIRMIRSDLRFRIDALFREAGIVIAFPQRDTHLFASEPLSIRLLDGRPGGET